MQNEIVALIIKLTLSEQDPDSPPARAGTLSALGAQPAETALYFSCFEAIPNVAKHAGRTAHARLGLHHEHDVLTVRLQDDGRGFDPKHTPDGAGLRNIDERIQALGGTVKLTSAPGLGIVLTATLPWPRTAEAGMARACPQALAIPVRDPQPHNGNLTARRDDRRQ